MLDKTIISDSVWFRDESIIKIASHEIVKETSEEMSHYISNELKIREGFTKLWVLALGAGEFWGCFAEGTPVNMADGRHLPIEAIEVGDKVISGKGNIRAVTALFNRKTNYSISLEVSSLPFRIKSSRNHPYYVARKEQFICERDKYKRCLPPTKEEQNICGGKTTQKRECFKDKEIIIEESRADDLRAGDFLVWSIPNLKPELEISVDEAYLIGAWLAEGHYRKFYHKGIGKKVISSLCLTTGWSLTEKLFREKISKCAIIAGFKYSEYDQIKTKSCVVSFLTNNVNRVREYYKQFFEYSHFKRVPPWVCCLSEESRLALVAGYFDGDGHYALSYKDNRVTARSASRDLVLGMQRVLWSLRIPATVCIVNNSPNNHYNLSFPVSYAKDLEKHSVYFRNRELKQISKVHSFYHKGKMYLPIRAIEEKEETISVYNIEVEEDHNYNVLNIGVKNSNRNGDFFPEEALKKYHKTFEIYGHFHRNHKNKVNDPKYGYVEKSIYNSRMHRVELIIAIDNTKNVDILQMLENKEDIAVSMAAKLPYDICSICDHRRTKPGREFTCIHINDELTKLYEDGRQVYAINWEPRFFDISKVFKPADRTAYVFKKVESDKIEESPISTSGRIYMKEFLNKEAGLEKAAHMEEKEARRVVDRMVKLATIKKLAELEKQIEGEVIKKVPSEDKSKIRAVSFSVDKDANLPDKVLEKLRENSPKNSLASTADAGIVLRLPEFLKVLLGTKNVDEDLVNRTKPEIRGIFGKLLKEPEDIFPEDDLDFASVKPYNLMRGLLSPYYDSRSILPEPAIKRSITIIMIKNKPDVELSELSSEKKNEIEKKGELNKNPKILAKLYGLYKIASVNYIHNKVVHGNISINDMPSVAMILENYL